MKEDMLSLLCKRIIVALVLAVFASTTAWADDSGECGDGVTYSYVESTHTLTISKTGEGKGTMTDYSTASSTPWVNNGYERDIQTVVIESGVTTIGSYAFANCFYLSSVTIPASMTSIGNYAFLSCSVSLSSVTIPEGVTSIGNCAFTICSALSSVTIPASVTSIGQHAFQQCTSLKTVYVLRDNTNGITTLGDGTAFLDAPDDLKIYVPYTALEAYKTGWSQYADKIKGTFASGGEGTEESPYLIKTYDNLKDFATYVNNGKLTTEYVRLDADIDCTDKTDFTPIGTESSPFKGYFNGSGKTISNLRFISTESTNFAGLFGKVESSNSLKKSVENLRLSNCTFKGGDMTGAIAAFLSKGVIRSCVVMNCTLETGNPQNPECGGIAGRLDQGKIMVCDVSGVSISAVTTYTASPGTSYAGGIVGKCYKNANNTINDCLVVTGEGDVTITSSHANATSTLYAGAIIGGTADGDGSELTLESNGYDSSVTTSTKAGTAEAVVKSGQTQRGIGSGDDVIGQVQLAGVKKVTVEIMSSNGNVRWDAVEGTYYTKTITNGYAQIDYYVLPGCNFTFSMKPKNGYKPRFALSEPTIEVTTKEIIEDGAYDHTEFTFTMPNKNVEVIWSYPIDLAAISVDNFSIDDANYTGEAIVPTTVKVKGAPGSANFTRELKKDEDFTIKGYKLNMQSVTSPVEIGIYTVTIEGMGDYTGTQDVSYEIVKSYALKINGTQLNAKNIDDFYGDKKVKFTPATETEPTNILTLNGASINGAIESRLGDLTIHLTGDNTITATGSETSLIKSTNGGTLTFETDATAGGSLKFKNVDGGAYANPISEFNSAECLIIEGSLMTDGQVIGVSESSIAYNSTDKILTFKEYHGGLTSQIITGVTGLTVKLEGTSSVPATSLDYLFKAMTNTASIKFVSENGGRLDMATKGSSEPFEGFADGKITYDKLVYWYDNTNGNEVHTIQAPTAPVMDVDADEKVTLTKPYADGDIYYTIVYADGKTPEVSKTKFTAAFALEAPGTVEAWVEANGATTGKTKGKRFGYQDAPFTLKVGDSKSVVIIPAMGDGISLVDNPTSSNEGIAACSDGVITAYELGNATLTTMLQSNSGVVILNDGNVVKTTINVGDSPQITFGNGLSYATYYNQSGYDRTVPEGLTAYAITGTSGNSVTLEEVGFMPNKCALLLKRADTKTEVGISLIYSGSQDFPDNNMLTYAKQAIDVTAMPEEKDFVLYKDEFVKATGIIPAGKCYLELTDPANSRSFIIDDGNNGTTGINSVPLNEEMINNHWYDLQGRKIQKPSKAGIYIQNGKKTIIK